MTDEVTLNFKHTIIKTYTSKENDESFMLLFGSENPEKLEKISSDENTKNLPVKNIVGEIKINSTQAYGFVQKHPLKTGIKSRTSTKSFQRIIANVILEKETLKFPPDNNKKIPIDTSNAFGSKVTLFITLLRGKIKFVLQKKTEAGWTNYVGPMLLEKNEEVELPINNNFRLYLTGSNNASCIVNW